MQRLHSNNLHISSPEFNLPSGDFKVPPGDEGDGDEDTHLSGTRASPSCPGSRSPRRSCQHGPPARRSAPRSRWSSLRVKGQGELKAAKVQKAFTQKAASCYRQEL